MFLFAGEKWLSIYSQQIFQFRYKLLTDFVIRVHINSKCNRNGKIDLIELKSYQTGHLREVNCIIFHRHFM